MFLEILNEPFEPIISAPGSNSEAYLEFFLPPMSLLPNSRTVWRQASIENFHDAVGAAITEIQNINDEYTIIVPNYVALPFGPKMYYQTHSAPSYYTATEVPKIERLVYTWHLYEPMKFTHFNSFAFEYFQDRDWYGEEHAPELPAWNPYDCDGLGDGFTPPVNLGNQTIQDVNNLIVSWSNNASVNLGYNPMVYFGEFGCEYKTIVTVIDPFVDLPGGPPTPPATVNQREAQRYQWLFDTRKFIETEVPNSGWSVYAYVGYMPIFRKSNGVTGDLYAPNNFNAHGPDRGDIHDNTSRALFGNVRPIGGGL